MYELSNGPDHGTAKRTSPLPLPLPLPLPSLPTVRGAGSTRSRWVCVTLAFAAVRSCGRDSMPIQSPSFGLLWKWPKHSERNPLNRKGKPSPATSPAQQFVAVSIPLSTFFSSRLIAKREWDAGVSYNAYSFRKPRENDRYPLSFVDVSTYISFDACHSSSKNVDK